MSTDGKPTMELTRNPVDGSWGFICREHGTHRAGLTERHATNVEAKHIREQHAEPETPTLDLTSMAKSALRLQEMARGRAVASPEAQRWDAALALLEDLTGLGGLDAVEFFATVAASPSPVRAAVAPF